MKEDFFQKAYRDAVRRSEAYKAMRFLEWAEETHPATVNRLKQAYEKSKEGGEK